ncbi:MAG: hypothetical protein ACYC36_02580 [Bellilinea sp.]
MLADWTKNNEGEYTNYTLDDIPGCTIRQNAEDQFFAHLDAVPEAIGPLPDFKSAEDIILQIGVCLVEYEKQLWNFYAAKTAAANTVPAGETIQ